MRAAQARWGAREAGPPQVATSRAVVPGVASQRARGPSLHRSPRRLSADQRSAIRGLAGTKSLRSLAADFGVSHETVRAVVRGRVESV